jgi:hypothetical protein
MVLAVLAFSLIQKRGVRMTVSYKTMQKNKKLDEFVEEKETEDEEE